MRHIKVIFVQAPRNYGIFVRDRSVAVFIISALLFRLPDNFTNYVTKTLRVMAIVIELLEEKLPQAPAVPRLL